MQDGARSVNLKWFSVLPQNAHGWPLLSCYGELREACFMQWQDHDAKE